MDSFDDIFEVLSTYRIIVCRACQFAVLLTQVQAHLVKHHNRFSHI